MKKSTVFFSGLFFSLVLLLPGCLSSGVAGDSPGARPGEIIVKFGPSITAGAAEKTITGNGGEVGRLLGERLYLVRLKPPLDVAQGVALFSSLPGVEYAEPNYTVRKQ